MALTPQQMVRLNQLLSFYTGSSNHPNLLAEMFEAFALANPAIATEWKTETLAKVQAQQASTDQPFTDAITAINSA
jgi:hypothetical protein